MSLQTYIQVHFNSDLTSLKTSFCNPTAAELIHDPNSEFWGGPEWKNYNDDIENVILEHRAYFCLCLFTMTSSDQLMFSKFRDSYDRFRNIFRYKKFGWCGFGPEYERPKFILNVPCKNGVDFSVISDDQLTEFVDSQFQIVDNIFGNEFAQNYFQLLLIDVDFESECEIFERLVSRIQDKLRNC